MLDPKLKNYAVSVLRSASVRWKAKNECLVLSRVERGLYKCNICGNLKKRNQVNVDHISPVVPLTGWVGFDDFIERLFTTVDRLQTLCLYCHDQKTAVEQEMRKYYTKERNEKKKLEEKEAKRIAKLKKKEDKNGKV